MLCPQCQSPIADTVKRCPFCGGEVTIKSRFSLGKSSLIISIASLIWVLVLLFLLRITNFSAYSFVVFCGNILILFSIASIILGVIAFFGKTRDILGLLGMFLGLFLIIGIALGISLGSSINYNTININDIERVKMMVNCVHFLFFP